MKFWQSRLPALLRLYITLVLIFVTQKMVFMAVNAGMAGDAPFGSCVAALWHWWGRATSFGSARVMTVLAQEANGA